MSNNAVAAMNSVQDKVRERIQASFMELIPEGLWSGMVEAELERFTKTELPNLVRQEARAKLLELIKAELNTPDWATRWGLRPGSYNTPQASNMVAQIVRDAAPELVTALFGGMVQQVVEQIRNGSIRSHY